MWMWNLCTLCRHCQKYTLLSPWSWEPHTFQSQHPITNAEGLDFGERIKEAQNGSANCNTERSDVQESCKQLLRQWTAKPVAVVWPPAVSSFHYTRSQRVPESGCSGNDLPIPLLVMISFGRPCRALVQPSDNPVAVLSTLRITTNHLFNPSQGRALNPFR
jgi:hypothetical protein